MNETTCRVQLVAYKKKGPVPGKTLKPNGSIGKYARGCCGGASHRRSHNISNQQTSA